MADKYLKINPQDNVAVALEDIMSGERFTEGITTFVLPQKVPAKHKFTTHKIDKDHHVIMYGVVVGRALRTIGIGELITTSNTIHKTSSFGTKPAAYRWVAPDISHWKDKTFLGYYRADGQVGVANYWLVIPLVFCENRNILVMREALEEVLGYGTPNPYKDYVIGLSEAHRQGADKRNNLLMTEVDKPGPSGRLFENIDGIKFLLHQGGCGGTRDDSEALCSLLAGYIHNPNVAGATVLSLGCQHAQASLLQEKLYRLDPSFSKKLILLEQQREGTEQALLTKAIRETFLALAEANRQTRKPAPLNKLVVGLECGGSDGFSGISANPAVGHASDLLVALGGTSILSEFPELCGIEQDLIDRCVDDTTAENFSRLMNAYSKAAAAAGSGFDMNPSPGNIRDGLITDAMKSAGAAKKGGTSPVCDVLDYGGYVTKPGLNLLCTPGNDVESTTAMAGAGATLILFTTGLGTPTGNPIAPVIKISSNSALARQMPDIIDLNAGTIIDGKESIEAKGNEILAFMVTVASGRKTKAMELDQNDFIPWKRGVSL